MSWSTWALCISPAPFFANEKPFDHLRFRIYVHHVTLSASRTLRNKPSSGRDQLHFVLFTEDGAVSQEDGPPPPPPQVGNGRHFKPLKLALPDCRRAFPQLGDVPPGAAFPSHLAVHKVRYICTRPRIISCISSQVMSRCVLVKTCSPSASHALPCCRRWTAALYGNMYKVYTRQVDTSSFDRKAPRRKRSSTL